MLHRIAQNELCIVHQGLEQNKLFERKPCVTQSIFQPGLGELNR